MPLNFDTLNTSDASGAVVYPVANSPTNYTLRSVVNTVVNGTPGAAVVPFDDPSNTSGLGTPAILRGTVSTYNLAGLTKGSGMSTAVRQANATALQNALNYCAANNKFFEDPPSIKEINSSTGLVVPACNGFVWRGEMYNSQIVQYYNGGSGAPIITLGDTTGSTSSNGWDVHGISATYGVSQSGLTSAQPVIVGAQTLSKIGSISLFNASFPSYDGFVWNGGGLGVFSCIFDNIILWQVQRDFLRNESGGTGNIIDNVYCNNGGTGTANAITGSYLNMASSTNDWNFRRLNLEWGSCQTVMSLNNQIGMHFDALHIEGITLSGFNPVIMGTTDSSVQIDVLDLIDLTAKISGGQALLQDYVQGSSVVLIGTFTWVNNHANQVTQPFQFYLPASSGIDDTLIYCIDGGYLRDPVTAPFFQGGNQVFFDNHMPVASFGTPNKFGRYEYGLAASRVGRAQIPVNATYTHYGQHEDATIIVPASITSFILTLAATMGATGTAAVRTGNTTRVRRTTGTPAGTLTVKDDAGTTLSTNTTVGDLWYIFNGTHYVTFTPVT